MQSNDFPFFKSLLRSLALLPTLSFPLPPSTSPRCHPPPNLLIMVRGRDYETAIAESPARHAIFNKPFTTLRKRTESLLDTITGGTLPPEVQEAERKQREADRQLKCRGCRVLFGDDRGLTRVSKIFQPVRLNGSEQLTTFLYSPSITTCFPPMLTRPSTSQSLNARRDHNVRSQCPMLSRLFLVLDLNHQLQQ